jgi:hypothetical protein
MRRLDEARRVSTTRPELRRYKQIRTMWQKKCDLRQAMDEGLKKMEKYEVWEVVPRQPRTRTLKARWVYTRKVDGETGKPSAFKARWVAKGYSQLAGVDYNKLYAGVAHKDSIRVFLSITNALGLHCDQVDIKAAFLNGELEEKIYLEPPEGSNIPSDYVLCLRKTLYGLKQSPQMFNKALDTYLRSEGLIPTTADPCIYTRRRGESLLMLSIHVDDQLISCTSQSELDEFKSRLNAKFECTDGGPVAYFLGFNIFRDMANKKLYISQEHYLNLILERFGMLDCQPSKALLPHGYQPIAATDEESADARHEPYPSMVGAIMYAATITRPDIAYASSLLARTASKWSMNHVKAAKHLLRYLKATMSQARRLIGLTARSSMLHTRI